MQTIPKSLSAKMRTETTSLPLSPST